MALVPLTQLGGLASLGCDPEFFFEQNGRIIGSEKVIGRGDHNIVPDGVQAELHTYPFSCRAVGTTAVADYFKGLSNRLKDAKYAGVKVSFRPVVSVTRKELDSLSPDSRVLGCAPSLNVYGQGAGEALSKVDAGAYRVRAAGGHIHLGLRMSYPHMKTARNYYGPDRDYSYKDLSRPEPSPISYDLLVKVLDTFLGNTCVMLDRHPGIKLRRELYGRAGEYRLPKHGLEYRTLSNFWLRSVPLMSFVMGMTRQAVALLYANNTYAPDHALDLLSRVPEAATIEAINTNNIHLARANWARVREFIATNFIGDPKGSTYTENAGQWALDDILLPEFDYFLSKDLSHWFPEDPMDHWCSMGDTHCLGWEAFLWGKVRAERTGCIDTYEITRKAKQTNKPVGLICTSKGRPKRGHQCR